MSKVIVPWEAYEGDGAIELQVLSCPIMFGWAVIEVRISCPTYGSSLFRPLKRGIGKVFMGRINFGTPVANMTVAGLSSSNLGLAQSLIRKTLAMEELAERYLSVMTHWQGEPIIDGLALWQAVRGSDEEYCKWVGHGLDFM